MAIRAVIAFVGPASNPHDDDVGRRVGEDPDDHDEGREEQQPITTGPSLKNHGARCSRPHGRAAAGLLDDAQDRL
jgi:hypothetical protein